MDKKIKALNREDISDVTKINRQGEDPPQLLTRAAKEPVVSEGPRGYFRP